MAGREPPRSGAALFCQCRFDTGPVERGWLAPGFLTAALVILISLLQAEKNLGCGLEQGLGFELLDLLDVASNLLNEPVEHLGRVGHDLVGVLGECCGISVHGMYSLVYG